MSLKDILKELESIDFQIGDYFYGKKRSDISDQDAPLFESIEKVKKIIPSLKNIIRECPDQANE